MLIKSELDYTNKKAALQASSPGSRSGSINRGQEGQGLQQPPSPRSPTKRHGASSVNWRRRHASMENARTLLPNGELNLAPEAPQCAKCGVALQEEELAFNRRLVEIAERKVGGEEDEARSGAKGGGAGSPSPSKRARENPEEDEPQGLYCIRCHYEVFVQPRGGLEAASEKGSQVSRRSRGSGDVLLSQKRASVGEVPKQVEVVASPKKEASFFWNSFYGHPLSAERQSVDHALLTQDRGELAAGQLLPKNWKQGLADKLQSKYAGDEGQWNAKIQRSLDKQRVKSRIGRRLAEENQKILQNAAFRSVNV